MWEVTSDTAADYLRSTGRVAKDEPVLVRELSGGVSNLVLLVILPTRGEPFVLKQARGRLRVKEEWLCPVERIWREVEVLRICGELLQVTSAKRAGGRKVPALEPLVPRVLWEDRDNYLYAMTAAPMVHRTWKELLLAGETALSGPLAIACGGLLGQLHAASWANPQIAGCLDDRAYFDQLRIDPYYRQVARVHADLAPEIERLIDSVWQNRWSLVHGDFSPKNLLVWPGHLMLIDFEVGHFGDPAFDLGFFLTHLILKSIWAGERRSEYLNIATEFWRSYHVAVRARISAGEMVSLEQRMVWNLAGCLLARVDGKSPVEYLSARQQTIVRNLARHMIVTPWTTWDDAADAVLGTEY